MQVCVAERRHVDLILTVQSEGEPVQRGGSAGQDDIGFSFMICSFLNMLDLTHFT